MGSTFGSAPVECNLAAKSYSVLAVEDDAKVKVDEDTRVGVDAFFVG